MIFGFTVEIVIKNVELQHFHMWDTIFTSDLSYEIFVRVGLPYSYYHNKRLQVTSAIYPIFSTVSRVYLCSFQRKCPL